MKTLILITGLPGVGKSHVARVMKDKLKGCFYFDSDLFSKEYCERYNIDFVNLPKEQQEKERLRFHKAKIEEVKQRFNDYHTVLLDTCFDLIPSRKMFYKFAKDNQIKLIIVEIVCSEETAKKRILKKRHEKERMVGTKEGRWEVYKQMKSRWTPIKNPDSVIDSDKEVEAQIALFLQKFNDSIYEKF